MAGALAATARADGDPASDVLATQSLFLPQDASIPPAQQAQLATLVSETARSGYAIRVAVIASSTDLGSVTALWGQPQNYAHFLDQELSLVYHGPLLVVMPAGFGVAGVGSAVSARQALAGVRIASGGAGLGAAALSAIQRLAATAGHPVAIPLARSPSAPGASDTIPLLAFAVGAALIALAWGASLRARPPRLPTRKAAP